ncbi:hypothetical protein NIES267_25060 [Calothrix parasitica NIES-267]|uniref:DUF6745 domain-containing protein n=1 Tax=Calothrix parasitica NIES-267 TaxID=1973488 RepID=A0A1Z4LP41_9CYAN|nr:hypothetical protein NIES267_25060 [Calothrix parasitica NIES-267]
MSENKIITELTPEQEALIPVYRDKWLKITLSTERINRVKATQAVKEFYKFIGEYEPEIIFFDSPYKTCEKLDRIFTQFKDIYMFNHLGHIFKNHICDLVFDKKATEILKKLGNISFRRRIGIEFTIYNELYDKGIDVYPEYIHDYSHPIDWATNHGAFYDFCISVLNLPFYQERWDILQRIVRECWWVFSFKGICLICERPFNPKFDEHNNLHADGKPAIQYADGFKVYSHHGIWLPEKYGSIPSSQWKSQWLLEEQNAELRRILIQAIGYNKIYQELGAIELDSWQEYTLLEIDNYTELNPKHPQNYSEPMHLLKMTCPSTGFIHFLRVPPDINSARTAITWINWGIDPEDFDIQS